MIILPKRPGTQTPHAPQTNEGASAMKGMPLAFVGHGSPMNAMEDNAWTAAWEGLAKRIPRPRAILCLSAHFVTRGLYVVKAKEPKTIHDFYGFPKEMYALRYPAPGSPELAEQAADLLKGQCKATEEWGLDHGAWSMLKRMYPEADIPAVQLSLDLSLTAEEQMRIGERLRPLRSEGVLILGSGNIVHNLREIIMGRPEPFPWALSFGEGVHELVLGGDYGKAAGYERIPGSLQSIATREHFIPLLNVLGAADKGDKAEAFNHDYLWGSMSMTGYLLHEEY
jgi:4,5-DOPA dioxygenase extradiol